MRNDSEVAGNVPAGKLAVEYEGYLRGELRVAESTASTYAAEARRFTCWLENSEYDARCVDNTGLEAYVASRGEGELLSARTISRIFSSLRSFFGFLRVAGYREDDPSRDVAEQQRDGGRDVLQRIYLGTDL